jgi:hypothetical protein
MSHGFRCGADMEPMRIRERTPDARFVARARLTRGADPFKTTRAKECVGDTAVWGILLSHPASSEDPPPDSTVVTDDGRTFEVRVLTEATDVADHAETVAAARYWELPPEYVRQLSGSDLTGS